MLTQDHNYGKMTYVQILTELGPPPKPQAELRVQLEEGVMWVDVCMYQEWG